MELQHTVSSAASSQGDIATIAADGAVAKEKDATLSASDVSVHRELGLWDSLDEETQVDMAG